MKRCVVTFLRLDAPLGGRTLGWAVFRQFLGYSQRLGQ